MIYYPVIIPTLNRYEHFKRCVESLSRNTYADRTELIIGLDYPPDEKYFDGYIKIKNYIPHITGFKRVTVFERSKNFGAVKNGLDLKNYAYSKYDAVIGTEDDNEFSPCFLDYMDKMLNYYKNEETVSSVCAYTATEYYGIKKSSIFFSEETSGWGLGSWREKEMSRSYLLEIGKNVLGSFHLSLKSMLSSPASFSLLLMMCERGQYWGDILRTQDNIVNGHFQVRPSISLCRNWGLDGSGLHCGIDEEYSLQSISTENLFSVSESDLKDVSLLKSVKKVTRRIHISNGKYGYLRRFVYNLIKYLEFRYVKRII